MTANLVPELFDHTAEKTLLGSLVVNPQCIDEVIPIVKPEDFHVSAHGMLFEQLLKLYNADRKIDPSLFIASLKKSGRLQSSEESDPMKVSVVYLAEITSAATIPSHLGNYAKVIQEMSILRQMKMAGERIVHDACYGTEDAAERINRAEECILSIQERRVDEQVSSLGQAITETLLNLDRRMAGDAVDTTVDTGFVDLDEKLGGFRGGSLIVLAARPSMGKSAFASNIAEYVSSTNKSVLFVSLEMSRLELADRMLCSVAQLPLDGIRRGTITREQRRGLIQAAGNLSAWPLFIDDTPQRSITEIAACARRIKRKGGLGLLVIDYLQLIEPDSNRDPREQQVAKIARRLKQLARSLEVPVLCLAQLNRKSEERADKKPRLSDLRESGAIEQDADVVLLLHRPDYYEAGNKPGVTEIDVAKQRNGPVGTVELTFVKERTRFESRVQVGEPWTWQ
jgi:replicative DNA helicase